MLQRLMEGIEIPKEAGGSESLKYYRDFRKLNWNFQGGRVGS